jgi:hypothetical protein
MAGRTADRPAGTLTRVVGALLMLISVIWVVVALAYLLIHLATGCCFDDGWSAGGGVVSGLVVAPVGILLSAILFGIGQHFLDEKQWRSGRRRGMATVHDLRPGDTSSEGATQELICRLEILVPDMVPLNADYRANIGPLDAPRFVESASFACEVSATLPERVRVWLFADPHADELTGRYRDFQLVRPGRDEL